MQKHNSKLSLGFTLIELLTVITILLVVTGGAIAGFIGFQDRRNVEETALQVRQFMVMAQQKASVRETPKACLDNQYPLRGYRVEFPTTNSVTLTALCVQDADNPPFPYPYTDSTSPGVTGTYNNVESFTFPGNVTVSPTSHVDFYTLEGGTNHASSRTYVFNGAQNYQFTVSPGGTISNVSKP